MKAPSNQSAMIVALMSATTKTAPTTNGRRLPRTHQRVGLCLRTPSYGGRNGCKYMFGSYRHLVAECERQLTLRVDAQAERESGWQCDDVD